MSWKTLRGCSSRMSRLVIDTPGPALVGGPCPWAAISFWVRSNEAVAA